MHAIKHSFIEIEPFSSLMPPFGRFQLFKMSKTMDKYSHIRLKLAIITSWHHSREKWLSQLVSQCSKYWQKIFFFRNVGACGHFLSIRSSQKDFPGTTAKIIDNICQSLSELFQQASTTSCSLIACLFCFVQIGH